MAQSEDVEKRKERAFLGNWERGFVRRFAKPSIHYSFRRDGRICCTNEWDRKGRWVEGGEKG